MPNADRSRKGHCPDGCRRDFEQSHGGCLKISPKTVEKHRGSAMRKLGLRCITELAGFGFQLFWDMTGCTDPAH
ncbi:MAG: LuxR C-terminal-related transcriptional regulator [Planctomyces sp.]